MIAKFLVFIPSKVSTDRVIFFFLFFFCLLLGGLVSFGFVSK